MFFCVYDMRKQGKTKGRKTRIEKNFHISPSTPFPPLSTTATQFGLRYSACRKVVGFLRFIQAQNERELIPRRACPRSTPTSSFGSPPPHQKKRVKWRLFCLLNSKLILIFGQRSPSYSYGRSHPGHFVYFVQKDLGGRSLCFSHAEFNIEIEVYKLKVQCGISDQIWLSRTVLTHVFMSCVSPSSR